MPQIRFDTPPTVAVPANPVTESPPLKEASERPVASDTSHLVSSVVLGGLSAVGAPLWFATHAGESSAEASQGAIPRGILGIIPGYYVNTARTLFNARLTDYNIHGKLGQSSFEASAQTFADSPVSSIVKPLAAAAGTAGTAALSSYWGSSDYSSLQYASWLPYMTGLILTSAAGSSLVGKMTDATFDYVAKPAIDAGSVIAEATGVNTALENSLVSKVAFVGSQILNAAASAYAHPEAFTSGAAIASGVLALRGLNALVHGRFSALADTETYFNHKTANVRSGMYIKDLPQFSYILNIATGALSSITNGAAVPQAAKDYAENYGCQDAPRLGYLATKAVTDFAEPLALRTATALLPGLEAGGLGLAATRSMDMALGSQSYVAGFESVMLAAYSVLEGLKPKRTSMTQRNTEVATFIEQGAYVKDEPVGEVLSLTGRVKKYSSEHPYLVAGGIATAIGVGIGALSPDFVTPTVGAVAGMATAGISALDTGLRKWLFRPAVGADAWTLQRTFNHYTGLGSETWVDGQWLPKDWSTRSISTGLGETSWIQAGRHSLGLA
ncbi:MAG: hypothetical protein KDK78_10785 [Chlamydiia bacterium]|nr:hypothetical protein [Chlamydiia bacterium]